jgi:hypothetical protein
MVKDVDAVELRDVVVEVLAVAPDAVLAAHHLPKFVAHLFTALARLHVHNLTRSLEAGSTRRKKGGEGGGGEKKRKKLRMKAWQGKQEIQLRVGVYPERENVVVYHSNLSRCGRRAKRAGYGQVRLRNIRFGHVLITFRQGRQRRDATATGEEQHGTCTAK